MQEITYINLSGERITFGGAPPFVFKSVQGIEGPAVSRKTTQGALRHGAQTVSALLLDRTVTLDFHIYGARDREQMYALRARLSEVLSGAKAYNSATGARGRLIYQNDHGTWWTWAIPTKRPTWTGRIQNIHPDITSLTFDCDSPYWFSMWESSGGFDMTAGFRLPFSFGVRFGARIEEIALFNKGQTSAPLDITLYGRGERIMLTNLTTGAKLHLAEPFPQGAVLHISTDPDDLYVRMEASGEVTNAYGYMDVTTPIGEFVLAPGRNVIHYLSGSATGRTAVEFRWRDRFEGV